MIDQIQRLMAPGLDCLVVNMPGAHSPEAVAMAGEVLTRALAG